MKIRILFMIDTLNIGGTEGQLLKLIEHLDKDRFEVVLVLLRESEYLKNADIPCEWRVIHVRSLLSVDGTVKLFQLASFLRQRKVDIVQTFFFDATVFGVLASLLAGVRVTISSRRDIGFWYTKKTLGTLRVINLLTRRILANSQAVKNCVVTREWVSPRKVHVISNGIDSGLFDRSADAASLRQALGIPAHNRVVGVVTNLNRAVKRVDLFIRSAAEVVKSMPDVSFVIVGDGRLKQGFQELAVSCGIEGRVIFAGAHPDPGPYISLFDVGVLTSDTEGLSNTILEYMAAGVPVVAGSAGGNPEIIIHGVNGLLYEQGDPEEISRHICSLLADHSLRDSIRSNNLGCVSRYFWSNVIPLYSSYYAGLAERYA